MIRPNHEIIRAYRPLINYEIGHVKNILKVGLDLMVAEESDEMVSAIIVSTAQKLISDATLEIANRN